MRSAARGDDRVDQSGGGDDDSVPSQTHAQIHTVQGGGGLRLHVREWGNADGPPILFIHGWSQNHLCWARQYESALADEFRLVAYDLRGHGMSEAPLEPAHYTDGALWADDVAAIIDAARLDRPVLVGWSYGAFVICDYVRGYGQDGSARSTSSKAPSSSARRRSARSSGPASSTTSPTLTADDLPTNIWALRAFVRACAAKPLPADDLETALCWNMAVPAQRPRRPGGARARLRRRAARARGAVARHPGPGGLGRAAGDGRAHPRDLPDRRGLLVRRRRSPAAPGGARALQPRAGRGFARSNHRSTERRPGNSASLGLAAAPPAAPRAGGARSSRAGRSSWRTRRWPRRRCLPRSQPMISTVISRPARATAIGTPRAARPVIRPSRGPGPQPAPT